MTIALKRSIITGAKASTALRTNLTTEILASSSRQGRTVISGVGDGDGDRNGDGESDEMKDGDGDGVKDGDCEDERKIDVGRKIWEGLELSSTSNSEDVMSITDEIVVEGDEVKDGETSSEGDENIEVDWKFWEILGVSSITNSEDVMSIIDEVEIRVISEMESDIISIEEENDIKSEKKSEKKTYHDHYTLWVPYL